ncbi:hypothetical protein ACIBH1_48715 [Nonomuraea sp. NPDC050663]|uniref:hypothetical protein n=1 Tax=Nonomuraea sp. NPDC050663 TaxID=3364370 RepID=UPI0037A0900C
MTSAQELLQAARDRRREHGDTCTACSLDRLCKRAIELLAELDTAEYRATAARIASTRVEFPDHTFWQAAGIWYARGPCPDLACTCLRTLHSSDFEGVAQQLRPEVRHDI